MKSLVFGFPPLVTSLAVFFFGISSFKRKPPLKIYRVFSGFCFGVSAWAFFYSLMYFSKPTYALFFARLGYLGVIFIPVFGLHYVFLLAELQEGKLIKLGYALTFIFLPITQTKFFLNGYRLFFWGAYPSAGPLYIFFVLYFNWFFLACVYYLYKSIRNDNQKNLVLYNQKKFVALAFLVASTSFVDYIPNYGYSIYPYGYLSAFGWVSLIAYATLRYRLMDTRILVRDTSRYILSYGGLSILFGFISFLITKQPSIGFVVFMMGLFMPLLDID
jgi:hypothetical protein